MDDGKWGEDEPKLKTHTNPPIPPFLAHAKHRDIPSIREISMYALLTHDNSNRLGCRILARECLDVCAVTQSSFDTLQVGNILEKIDAAWTDGRSSVNANAN